MRTRKILLLAPALLVAATLAGPAHAADNPLQPLTAVAKHVDAGLAAFLAGKPLAEAFAPWVGSVDEEKDEAKLREALKAAGATTARNFYLEYEIHYVKGETTVHRCRMGLWVTPQAVSLLEFSGRKTDASPSSDLVPLDATSESLKPFVDAGKAFDAAIRGDGWKAIPIADLEAVLEILGPAVPREDVKRDLEAAKEALAQAAAEIAELAPDRALVKVDDEGSLAYDAAGKTLGAVEGELRPLEDGRLGFRLGDFRAMPGK